MRECLADFYAGSPIVTVHGRRADGELLLRRSMAPSDRLDLYVFAFGRRLARRGWSRCSTTSARAPAARRCRTLNLMAGLPETAGLRL